jgi:hypothetical protein
MVKATKTNRQNTTKSKWLIGAPLVVSIIFSVGSLGLGVFNIFKAQRLENLQIRPYVGLTSITPELSALRFDAELENYGTLPAYDVSVNYKWKLQDTKTDTMLPRYPNDGSWRKREYGCLFHRQKILFGIPFHYWTQLQGNKDYKLIINCEIHYLRPNRDKEETAFECEYSYKGDIIITKSDAT